MTKALSYRLFGLGAIPKKWRSLLEQEGIVVYDEGMPGWLIAKHVKGPGKRYLRRAEGFSGCLVITKQRITCFTYRKRQINISVQDPNISELRVSVPAQNRLSLAFEPAVFQEGWQGTLEFRFKTNKAQAFYDALSGLGAQEALGAASPAAQR
jgi:hypothetical protein